MSEHPLDMSSQKRRLDDLGPRFALIAGICGGVVLAASAAVAYATQDGPARFFHAYLVSFTYFLSLALGALFFVILQHLTRSGWSVVLRRLAECIAANVGVLAVLCLPVIAGLEHLYPWTDGEAVARDPVLQGKQPYLNVPFFLVRLAGYFAVWLLLARFFHRRSVAQDASGDVGLTLGMQRFSGPAMVLFAITVTFAAFDLLMSLDPHWFSTMFGVYYFCGSVVGFFALLALVALLVQRAGRLTRAITVEHYHDVGKLIFAFVIFWAYIAFSQYMLIWYANIPEETAWYLRRQSGGWAAVGLVLLFGHFVVPFLALISRAAKRRPAVLAVCALWVLLMHWVDLYWLVMPEASPQSARPHLLDLTCFLGLGGLFAAATARRLGRQSLLPARDPRLPESLAFENV